MAGQSHHHPHSTSERALTLALSLVAGYLLVEVVTGVLARSLALLADAGHLLVDVAALGASLLAIRFARRPARGGWTFGLQRLEVLAAQGNGALLLVVGLFLGAASVRRLVHPVAVHGLPLVVVAAVGMLVNGGAALILGRGNRGSLNTRAALAHVRTDVFASAAAVIAGLTILATGWQRADPVASLVVVALVLGTAVRLLAQTGRVLLEAAPADCDPARLRADMLADDRVASVHDLHLWLITSGFPALAAHVLVRPGDDCHAVRAELERMLLARHSIRHTTLQVEHAQGDVLQIGATPSDHSGHLPDAGPARHPGRARDRG